MLATLDALDEAATGCTVALYALAFKEYARGGPQGQHDASTSIIYPALLRRH